MADSVPEVWQFRRMRLEYETAKDGAAQLLDTMVLCVHSGNGTPHFASDYERHCSQSSRTVRHHISFHDFVVRSLSFMRNS
jgi:hypothetical protein